MNKSYESYTTAGVEKKFRNLEDRIMKDVVRRIKKTKTITSAADYQLNRYRILGNSTKDIEDIIKSAVGDDFPETFELYDEVIEKQYTRSRDLYEQVNETFIPFEQNLQLQQISSALIQQSNDDLYNITRSMGFKIDMGRGTTVFTPLADYYNQYLDDAMVEITSGAFDYNTVMRRVVTQMTNSGLRTVEYASGMTSRCDVAARRAIMTGLTQLTGKITDTNAQKLHTDYFEIAWHGGARPTHRIWQGKVWSSEELVSVCGLGTVRGLEGANCYHERYPFIKGISERQWSDTWLSEQNRKEDTPKEFKGRKYTLYEATQRQRYLETNMRAQRQKVELLQEAKADPDEIMLARCKYQAQLDEYKAFSEKMELPEQRERIYYDMKGRVAPGRKAYKAYLEKQAEKLSKVKKSSIIESVDEGKNFTELTDYFQTKHGITISDEVKKLDFEAVKRSMSGVAKVVDEFPAAKGVLKRFATSNHGVMAASYDGTISFTPAYYEDISNLNGMIAGPKSGFHPKNTGILETGSHEMGHLLERALIEKYSPGPEGIQAWNSCRQARAVVSEACRAAKKTDDGNGLLNAALKKQISGYSVKDDSECLAEAVADYIANGEQAEVLSKEIWKILKRELG